MPGLCSELSIIVGLGAHSQQGQPSGQSDGEYKPISWSGGGNAIRQSVGAL